MEASENTLKKYLVQLICSGELQYGINYGEQIINLSNFNENQITDINRIITGIRQELDSTALAEVSRNNLSTLSTGIGDAVTTLYSDRVLGIDLSTLSTHVGQTFEKNSLENLLISVSSLSTVINTNYDEFTSYRTSMANSITTSAIAPESGGSGPVSTAAADELRRQQDAAAAEKQRKDRELTETLALVPVIAGLAQELAGLGDSILKPKKCVKGKSVKRVSSTAKCPKGFKVKR
jgi:hypothetical protein